VPIEPTDETFHGPLELTLDLTGCCARARDFGVAVCECSHFEPSAAFPPSPHWCVLTSPYVCVAGGGELFRESNPV